MASPLNVSIELLADGSQMVGVMRSSEKSLNSFQNKLKQSTNKTNLFDGALANLNQGFNRFKTVVNNSSQYLHKFMKSMGDLSFSLQNVKTALVAITAPFRDVWSVGSDFEAQMSRVGAISRATQQEFEALSNKARQLGSTTRYSASEVAKAQEYLSLAGFSATQNIQALDGVLSLAAASGEDLATVSDIVSDQLSALKMDAADTTKLSNALARAMSTANTTVAMLGDSLKYTSPVFTLAGQSMETLVASTSLLANIGIKSSQSGTSLKMALLRLAAPPKLASEQLDKLNIKVSDSSGKFRDFTDILADFNKNMAKMTAAQKLEAVKKIVGVEATASFIELINQSKQFTKTIIQNGKATKITTTNLKEYVKVIEGSSDGIGAAAEMSSRMIDNLKGDWLTLKSTSEEAYLTLFYGVNNGLRAIVQFITYVIQQVTILFRGFGEGFAPTFEAFKSLKNAFSPIYNALQPLVQLFYNWLGITETGNGLAYKLGHTIGVTLSIAIITLNEAFKFGLKIISPFIIGLASLANHITALVQSFSQLTVGMSFFEKIQNALLLSADWLLGLSWNQIGINLIATLARGITQAGQYIYNAIVSVFRSIVSLMPSSPAKSGPLSKLLIWGIAIPKTIAKGILFGYGSQVLLRAVILIFEQIATFIDHFKWESIGISIPKNITNGILKGYQLLVQATSSIFERLAAFINNFKWGTFGVIIPKTIAISITGGYQLVLSAITKLNEKILAIINNFEWSSIGIVITDNIQKILVFTPILNGLVSGLRQELPDIINKINSFFKGAVNVIKIQLNELINSFSNIFNSLIAISKQVTVGVLNVIKTFFAQLDFSVLLSGIVLITGVFGNFLKMLVPIIAAGFNLINLFLQAASALGGLANILSTVIIILTKFSPFLKIISILASLGGLVYGAWEPISSLIEGVVNIWNQLDESVKRIIISTATAVTAITAVFLGAPWLALLGTLTVATEFLGVNLLDVATNVKNFFSNITTTLIEFATAPFDLFKASVTILGSVVLATLMFAFMKFRGFMSSWSKAKECRKNPLLNCLTPEPKLLDKRWNDFRKRVGAGERGLSLANQSSCQSLGNCYSSALTSSQSAHQRMAKNITEQSQLISRTTRTITQQTQNRWSQWGNALKNSMLQTFGAIANHAKGMAKKTSDYMQTAIWTGSSERLKKTQTGEIDLRQREISERAKQLAEQQNISQYGTGPGRQRFQETDEFKNLKRQAAKEAQQTRSAFQSATADMINTYNRASGVIKNKTAQTANYFNQTWNKASQSFLNATNRTQQAFSNFFNNSQQQAKQSFDNMGQQADKYRSRLKKITISAIAIGGLALAFSGTASAADGLDNVTQSASLLEQTLEGLKASWEWVKNNIEVVSLVGITILTSGFIELSTVLALVAKTAGLAAAAFVGFKIGEYLYNEFSIVRESAITVVGVFVELGQSLIGFYNTIISLDFSLFGQTLLESVRNIFVGTEEVKVILNDMLSGLGDIIMAPAQLVTGITGTLGDAFGQAAAALSQGNLIEAGAIITNGLIDAIQNMANTLIDAIVGIIKLAAYAILPDSWYEPAINLIDGFVGAVTGSINLIIDAVQVFIGAAGVYLSNVSWTDLGRDLLNTFISVITLEPLLVVLNSIMDNAKNYLSSIDWGSEGSGLLATIIVGIQAVGGLLIASVQGLLQGVENYLLNLDLSASGRALILTLVAGVKNAAGQLKQSVVNVLEDVRRLLPFSDAKEGPFSTLTESGRAVMLTMASGIKNGQPILKKSAKDAFNSVANEIAELEKRAKTIGMTSEQLKFYELRQRGVNEQAIQYITSLQRQITAEEAFTNKRNELLNSYAGLTNHEKEIEALRRKGVAEQQLLEISQLRLQIEQKKNDTVIHNAEQELAILRMSQTEKEQFETLKQFNASAATDEQKQKLLLLNSEVETQKQINDIWNKVSDSSHNFFESVIAGTATAKDAFKKFANDIASTWSNAISSMAQKQISTISTALFTGEGGQFDLSKIGSLFSGENGGFDLSKIGSLFTGEGGGILDSITQSTDGLSTTLGIMSAGMSALSGDTQGAVIGLSQVAGSLTPLGPLGGMIAGKLTEMSGIGAKWVRESEWISLSIKGINDDMSSFVTDMSRGFQESRKGFVTGGSRTGYEELDSATVKRLNDALGETKQIIDKLGESFSKNSNIFAGMSDFQYHIEAMEDKGSEWFTEQMDQMRVQMIQHAVDNLIVMSDTTKSASELLANRFSNTFEQVLTGTFSEASRRETWDGVLTKFVTNDAYASNLPESIANKLSEQMQSFIDSAADELQKMPIEQIESTLQGEIFSVFNDMDIVIPPDITNELAEVLSFRVNEALRITSGQVEGLDVIQQDTTFFETLKTMVNDFVGTESELTELTNQMFSLKDIFHEATINTALLTESFINSSGGIDKLVESASFFQENFTNELTKNSLEVESSMIIVDNALNQLNQQLPSTREQFANLIQTTAALGESGANTAQTLLEAAPAFDTFYSSLERVFTIDANWLGQNLMDAIYNASSAEEAGHLMASRFSETFYNQMISSVMGSISQTIYESVVSPFLNSTAQAAIQIGEGSTIAATQLTTGGTTTATTLVAGGKMASDALASIVENTKNSITTMISVIQELDNEGFLTELSDTLSGIGSAAFSAIQTTPVRQYTQTYEQPSQSIKTTSAYEVQPVIEDDVIPSFKQLRNELGVLSTGLDGQAATLYELQKRYNGTTLSQLTLISNSDQLINSLTRLSDSELANIATVAQVESSQLEQDITSLVKLRQEQQKQAYEQYQQQQQAENELRNQQLTNLGEFRQQLDVLDTGLSGNALTLYELNKRYKDTSLAQLLQIDNSTELNQALHSLSFDKIRIAAKLAGVEFEQVTDDLSEFSQVLIDIEAEAAQLTQQYQQQYKNFQYQINLAGMGLDENNRTLYELQQRYAETNLIQLAATENSEQLMKAIQSLTQEELASAATLAGVSFEQVVDDLIGLNQIIINISDSYKQNQQNFIAFNEQVGVLKMGLDDNEKTLYQLQKRYIETNLIQLGAIQSSEQLINTVQSLTQEELASAAALAGVDFNQVSGDLLDFIGLVKDSEQQAIDVRNDINQQAIEDTKKINDWITAFSTKGLSQFDKDVQLLSEYTDTYNSFFNNGINAESFKAAALQLGVSIDDVINYTEQYVNATDNIKNALHDTSLSIFDDIDQFKSQFKLDGSNGLADLAKMQLEMNQIETLFQKNIPFNQDSLNSLLRYRELTIDVSKIQINALLELTDAVNDFASLADSLAFDQSLSPLNDYQKYQQAKNNYEELKNAALEGDVEAIKQLGEAGKQLLTLSRDFNASSVDYMNDFNTVVSDIELATEIAGQIPNEIDTIQQNTVSGLERLANGVAEFEPKETPLKVPTTNYSVLSTISTQSQPQRQDSLAIASPQPEMEQLKRNNELLMAQVKALSTIIEELKIQHKINEAGFSDLSVNQRKNIKTLEKIGRAL